jgi:hypothetical protein
MITLFFISLIAFIAGITAVTLKYSIPASISESYYLLPPKARIPIFYGWTVLVALPLAVFWLDISGGTAQTLVFFLELAVFLSVYISVYGFYKLLNY